MQINKWEIIDFIISEFVEFKDFFLQVLSDHTTKDSLLFFLASKESEQENIVNLCGNRKSCKTPHGQTPTASLDLYKVSNDHEADSIMTLTRVTAKKHHLLPI